MTSKKSNLPDDLKFAKTWIEFLQWPVNAHSLCRIIAWFLFFLLLIHFITPKIQPRLPHMAAMQNQKLVPLATTPSDPRYLRLDQKDLPPRSVIWVAGSSITIGESQEEAHLFLPGQTADYLPAGTTHYISVKMARRFLDTYVMTLDAIERKPSALVVILNPFWVLQDQALFFKQEGLI